MGSYYSVIFFASVYFHWCFTECFITKDTVHMLLIIQITKDFFIYLRLDFLLKKGFRQLTAKSSHFPVLSISWPIDYFKWISKKPCMILLIPLQNTHSSVPEWLYCRTQYFTSWIIVFLQFIMPKEDLLIVLEEVVCWRIRVAEVVNECLVASSWVHPSFLSSFLLFLFLCLLIIYSVHYLYYIFALNKGESKKEKSQTFVY